MRKSIRLAARIYPRRWRERYGGEFDALLDDADAGPREFADVVKGALTMQLLTGSAGRLAAAMAIAGAIVAGAISFRLPERYVSTAVLRVSAYDFAAPQLSATLSRSSLAEIVQRPSLQLYPKERQRIPMEDVLEQMRTRDIRVQTARSEWQISFAYPNPVKAQAVTRALTARFIESAQSRARFRADGWRQIWPDAPAPSGGVVEVVDPASLPRTPTGTNRLTLVAAGLGVGLLAGLITAACRRQPRSARRLAAWTFAGCALGLAVWFVLPSSYASTAVLRISPPLVPDDPHWTKVPPPLAERLLPMQQEVLSRHSLADLIQRPALNLYPEDRTKLPLEDVVAKLRNHLMIRPVGADAFQITFVYSDAIKAQAVVREIITRFMEQNVAAARARIKDRSVDDPAVRIEERRLGSNLEVLDPASLPQSPVAPNWLAVTAIGTVLGLMIGALTLLRSARQMPQASCPEWRPAR